MALSGSGRGLASRFGTWGGMVAGGVIGAAMVVGYFVSEPTARATAVVKGSPVPSSAPAAAVADSRNDADTTTGDRMAALPVMKGPSGLPLPRFVSLKSNKVNVRRGPSREYGIAWVYEAKGLPVEVVAEFGNWRRIRDAEGAEGWVLRTLLSGWRTAMIAPWNKNGLYDLRETPDGRTIARVKSGVIGRLLECDGQWCRLKIGGYTGWIEQSALWGVYPSERIATR